MGQPATRTRARRVVELRITCRRHRIGPVVDNGVRVVMLAQFDAVRVELVVLQVNRALQLPTTFGPCRAGLRELVEDRPTLFYALVRPEPESSRYWEHVGNALHRAVDDLLADRLAFVVVAVKQVVARVAGQ